jgi:aldose 1-epimerase
MLLATQGEAKTMVTKKPFGKTAQGMAVDIYTLKSDKLEATITTYGGRVVTLKVPDRTTKPGDIVLGFDTLADYEKTNPYFGALIGRYGNRIGHAQFALDGHTFKLPNNDNGNTLHGGKQGFDRKVWGAKVDGETLVLTYVSKDGEEGFPGNLSATVKYSLSDTELKIEYSATTDKNTVVNLTNHSYFNLSGQGEGDILRHDLSLFGDRYTPVDKTLIPTGELRSVAGTPFDFRTPHAIGERINADDEQIKFGKGYDHNWALPTGGGSLVLAARVHDRSTGRIMDVLTTEPGLQFYTGNFLDGTLTGKGGKVYKQRYAFCMETQHFPDSPNKPKFPSTELKPGQQYHTTTVYRFSVK